jgi:hypothetical protein
MEEYGGSKHVVLFCALLNTKMAHHFMDVPDLDLLMFGKGRVK